MVRRHCSYDRDGLGRLCSATSLAILPSTVADCRLLEDKSRPRHVVCCRCPGRVVSHRAREYSQKHGSLLRKPWVVSYSMTGRLQSYLQGVDDAWTCSWDADWARENGFSQALWRTWQDMKRPQATPGGLGNARTGDGLGCSFSTSCSELALRETSLSSSLLCRVVKRASASFSAAELLLH